MINPKPPPPPQKQLKTPHLILYFPVTAKMGNTRIYKLNERGLTLVRTLAGMNLEDTPLEPPC